MRVPKEVSIYTNAPRSDTPSERGCPLQTLAPDRPGLRKAHSLLLLLSRIPNVVFLDNIVILTFWFIHQFINSLKQLKDHSGVSTLKSYVPPSMLPVLVRL